MQLNPSDSAAPFVLPSPKEERWKYTNLPPVVKGLPTEPEQDALRRIETDADITVTGKDGAFIVTPSEISVKAGAHIIVIERYEGTGQYWQAAQSRIIIEKDAKLTHIRLFENDAKGVSTLNSYVSIEEKGTYETFNLIQGGALTRCEMMVDLDGEGAEAHISGLNLLRGRALGDHSIIMNHKVPGCISTQNVRSVLDERARGVFQGKTCVFRDAQKTDAKQMSRALLLSEGAEMDTKPELEIYADDVKCAHGATCGTLDETALFYMRARGIPEDDARSLLIAGFVDELVDGFGDKAVREIIRDALTPPSQDGRGDKGGRA